MKTVNINIDIVLKNGGENSLTLITPMFLIYEAS